MLDKSVLKKCDRKGCGKTFKPRRQAQSYCSRECKRAAAYGRERFQRGTKGPRRRFLIPRLEASDRRLLEASETLPGRVVAGSVRKHGFSATRSVACKEGNTHYLGISILQDLRWPHLYRIHWPDGVVSTPTNLTRRKDAVRRNYPALLTCAHVAPARENSSNSDGDALQDMGQK